MPWIATPTDSIIFVDDAIPSFVARPSPMRDFDIRVALRDRLRAEHAGEPDTAIVDELGICQGEVRVDLAVVNGSLNGYEIKSERDCLDRLPHQRDAYNRCFDTVTLVSCKRHLGEARGIIPRWWGIIRPQMSNGRVEFTVVRRPKTNRAICSEAVVQLLWREEALAVLEQIGEAKGVRTKPRRHLWDLLVRLVPLPELKNHVRAAIKARGEWRSDSRRVRGNGSLPISATPPDSQANLSWLISLGSQYPPR
jgi:hypothetical protein